MLRPSIFGESLFDDWMDDFPFGKEFEKEMFPEKSPLYGKHAKNMMKTDVRETDDSYEVDIDLPGFKKDEVNVKLEDGYITPFPLQKVWIRMRKIRRTVSISDVNVMPAV